MRSLEDIEKDLAAAREALSHAEGTPAEVYSRIVGYYRSVRNWNRGKREEYGERKLFCLPEEPIGFSAETVLDFPVESAAKPGAARKLPAAEQSASVRPPAVFPAAGDRTETAGVSTGEGRILLFVRPTCPACPGAKAAAGKLGIPVDLVNADTEAGMAEAVKRQVFSTPTAILLTGDGQELGRALDAGSIGKLIAV
jgi:ribonucleoside-triphosphate reductase